MDNFEYPNVKKFTDAYHQQLSYLAYRWNDEKEYESFTHYAKNGYEAVVQHNLKFIKMTKKPFGVKFSDPTVPGKTFWLKALKNRVVLDSYNLV